MQAQLSVNTYNAQKALRHGSLLETNLKNDLRKIEEANEEAEKARSTKGEGEADVIIRDIVNVLLQKIAKSGEHKVKANAIAALYSFMTENMEFLSTDDKLFDFIEAKTLRFIQLTSEPIRDLLRTMETKRINGKNEETETRTLRRAFGAQSEALEKWLKLSSLVAHANRSHDDDFDKFENRLVKNRYGIHEFDMVPRGSSGHRNLL